MKKANNLLIIDGGAVKTNDEGLVTGLGIVFGSPDDPDQSSMRDFFTADTYVRKSESFSIPLYYDHGYGVIKNEIGEATITKTDDGWVAEAQLDLTSDSGKAVYESVKDTPHGFSTGALGHLVQREEQKNGTNFIKRWVVGEISLTTRPAEKKAVVQTVKSISVDSDGNVVSSDQWAENPVTVKFLDKDGKEINITPDTKQEDVEIHSIGVKWAGGYVEYYVYTGDDETGESLNIAVTQYTNAEEILNQIAALVRQGQGNASKNVEVTVEDILKSEDFKNAVREIVGIKSDESEKIIADLELELANRESALTEANEKIALLETLAGAKDTINKYKGNN